MQTRTLDWELRGLDNGVRLFAKYSYWAISRCGFNDGVGVTTIVNYVKNRFLNRRSRGEPPYLSEFDEIKRSKLLVEGLTMLEQRGIVELNEGSGRYKALK